MAQLRQDYDRFAQRGAEVLVVGPESADAFREYFTRNDLPFTGLPDPDHRVLKLYGQKVNLFKMGRMPAQVLIDRFGTARFVHYGRNMRDIPANQVLLDLVDRLNDETG